MAGVRNTERRRTLFITIDPPYPATSGAPLRNWQNVCLASALGPVAVLSIGHDPSALERMPNVAVWEHVVIPRIASVVPRGYPIVSGGAAALVRPILEQIVRRFDPAVTVLENFWLDDPPASLGAEGRRLILDTHNVYSCVAEELGLDTRYVRERERHAIGGVDEVWTCSTDDAARIVAEYGVAEPPRAIPNGIDVGYYAAIRSRRSRRLARGAPNLLFVGSFWYEPNRVAAERLAFEIVPRIVSMSGREVRCYLVGAAPSEAMLAASREGRRVVVPGRVPDVRPYLALADVVVVPLLHGGGTRIKLLEAFAAERAIVATAKAAEGLDVRDGEQLLMRESDDEIAQAVCALIDDPARATRLARAGYELVATTYSWEALRSLLHEALAAAPARAESFGGR
jgi:glycosyltransferase involved in cell wall biosynthesis